MIVIITAQGILDALTLPSYDQIVFQQSFHDFIMVLLAAFVYGMYDYWIEIKLTSNLQENLERQVLVLRQGQIDNLHIRDLVTGDIISLKQGDCVPVDIVVIESDGLEIDEKQVFNKDKQLQEDMQTIILAGSYIMRGQCKGLVCQVGKQLIAQKVSKKLQYLDQNIPTPNQFKSYVVGKYILKVSVIISIIISGILLSRILIEDALMLHQETYIELFQQGLYVLKVFILLLFVALPENASICISTYFAINMEKMRKEGILVRSLEALEVMGSTVELLAGKTGILTENRMTVVRVFSEGNLHLNITRLQPKTQELIIQGCSLNSNSHILYDEQNDQELRIGNQIECAILKFVDSNLFKLNYREKCYQDVRDRFKILRVIPFSQDNKKMTVVVELIPGKLVRVFTKGASENLIAECNQFIDNQSYKDISYDEYLVQYERLINQGQEKELSQIIDYQDQFQQELEQLEEEDIIQRANFDSEIKIQNKTQLLRLDQGLTLICILGIKDPLRLGIQKEIQRCQQAHVTVRMVTGDSIDTAISIAKEAGIVPSGGSGDSKNKSNSSRYRCLTGAQFRKNIGGVRTEIVGGQHREVINDVHAFREIQKELRVLARATSEDKYIFTNGLRNEGYYVALTGDGTKDSRSLKRANIGFSMGKTGSDIAKDASDIVLIEDDFSSLVKSIKWGRQLFYNARHFSNCRNNLLLILLTTCFVSVLVIGQFPFNLYQMILFSITLDIFLCYFIMKEQSKDDDLKSKPIPKNEPLITRQMCYNLSLNAILSLIVFFSLNLMQKFDLYPIAQSFVYDQAQTQNIELLKLIFTFVYKQKQANIIDIFDAISRSSSFVQFAINL
eukprot:403354399